MNSKPLKIFARVGELPLVSSVILLLKAICPPAEPIDDSNVLILLPLIEEYQMTSLKKQCEKHLLTVDPSLKNLITAQTYHCSNLMIKLNFVAPLL
ncbi:hypothetical protein A3Q56_05806 [Intoshia linei]|uniref:BTB domain-containing protein n=1 Tax=Intoshia linei TaxID=1819745 RepID=A0A177AX38_9BILA|nr:hypothetical protein A3Q56_05806 [Intoshia linei]